MPIEFVEPPKDYVAELARKWKRKWGLGEVDTLDAFEGAILEAMEYERSRCICVDPSLCKCGAS